MTPNGGLNGMLLERNPLDGWWIALVGARTLIGKSTRIPEDATPVILNPCYDFQRQYVQTPQGQTVIAMMVTPILLCASIREITLPTGAVLIRAWELSKNEQREIWRAIQNGEDQIRKMRAADAGLVL